MSQTSQQPTILVVDDSPDSLRLMNVLLRDIYHVKVASSGEKALAIAAADPPDLILLDIMMPEMDGFEVCGRLKADPATRDVPILFLSALSETTDKVKAFTMGGQDYITKPFQAEEVEARVKTHLSLARMHRELESANAGLEAANRRLASANAELAQVNQELDTFSHRVAHDLRAPLRHIAGFLEFLDKDLGGLEGPAALHMETIRRAARRMDELIVDLLAFSRSANAPLRFQRVDLGALVREVVEELTPGSERRSVCWEVGELPVVSGEPVLLRLVLQNLVDNALKYTQKVPQAHIRVLPIPDLGLEAGFVVRDNGAGFDPAQADHLFGAFQRLHSPSEFEGTGLGLANVRRIVERHGGRVWAEGTPGRGAAFFVSLPATKVIPAPGTTAVP